MPYGLFVWFFRGNELVSCYLHEQVASETMRAAECLSEPEGMFVIIQYARPSLSQVGGLI